jgi:hypothetical protein
VGKEIEMNWKQLLLKAARWVATKVAQDLEKKQ